MRLGSIVDDDGHQKHCVVRHIERTLDGQAPFSAEIALAARVGLRRYDGHEEVALTDLAADLLIPCISAEQVALVVPRLEPEERKGIPDELHRSTILLRIAQENRRARTIRSLRVGSGHAV